MQYRSKLMLYLVLVAVVTNSLSVAIIYTLARRDLFQQLGSEALSIASTIAAAVDGDLHKAIHTRADEASPEYLKLRDLLRRLRDANRRSDTYVKFVNTFTLAPFDPNVIVYGVDAEESSADMSHVGDVYRYAGSRKILIDQRQVDQTLTRDQWGEWLVANAPVRDSSGKITAALAVYIADQEVYRQLRPLILSGLLGLGLAVAVALGSSFMLSGRVSRPLLALRRAVEAIGSGDLDTKVELQTGDEFGSVAGALNNMAAGLRERERVKSALGRYVSQQVVDGVLSSSEMPSLRGDRRRVTVLFCDIRGFTSMSENMRPESVVEFLNEYFERMVEIVMRNQGTLDKFIGDGLMVIFGAPVEDPYQEEHAVRSALEMQQEFSQLSKKWELQGRSARIGVGINSGNAIVGNIGSTRRMEYTAIGDTVNLASRLESATKELGVDILISEYTYNAVRGAFKTNRMGSIQIKGRTDPVQTYSVENAQGSDSAA